MMKFFAIFAVLYPALLAAQPIRLHPRNPHYFLYRGKAVALVTSGEHYGSVMNLDFDCRRYLSTLAADGLNYTRIFGGSYREVPGKSFGIPGFFNASAIFSPRRTGAASWLRLLFSRRTMRRCSGG